MASVVKLGPTSGVHRPDYQITAFKDGDPRVPIDRVTWESTTAIQTSKAINERAGTFTVTLKDKRARHNVREMDVMRIRLRGHYSPSLITVMKCVVDNVRPAGSADVYAAQEDTIITGRCVGKYLQSTSLFLPVWDPESALPTALTFGYGDAAKKVGGNRPFDIYRYLLRRFTYAQNAAAGGSGIPNSRYWLDAHTRFSRKLGFRIPFLQFDETDMAEALERMEITGFTEAWVDELGRIVYRQPAWDRPVDYLLPTDELMDWSFPRGDDEAATYLEVIPAGDPGIDSATAQALRAGRAPVPSAYLNAGSDTSLAGTVTPGFVIDTDSKGIPTAKGRRNHWYRLQRRLGVRPQQISSPLLFTQEQAQAQAEGLLRFMSRMTKSMQVTIPGCPEARLGTTWRVLGELEGIPFDRTFYAEQISHDFVAGQGYRTSVLGTHGRDAWDPGFARIVLPTFTPAQLATEGGLLTPKTSDGGVVSGQGGGGGAPVGQTGNVQCDAGNGDFVAQTTRPDGVRMLPKRCLSDFLALLAGQVGHTILTNTYSRHSRLSTSGLQSDHWTGNGCDVHVTANWPGDYGTQIVFHAARLCGLSVDQANALARGGGDFTRLSWSHGGATYSVQILWGPNVAHLDHVHIGVR